MAVDTRADSTDTIYYRPDNSEIGTADGSGNTLTHAVESFLFRPQIGLGYQWPGEGNFLTLDFYSLKEVQETLVQFHYTLPSWRVNTSIPFLKLGVGLSHTDSEGLSPTALSWSLGLGAYHALSGSQSWRLEYGLDYTRREWLSINHHYGQESWSDRDWHLYLGTAWRF